MAVAVASKAFLIVLQKPLKGDRFDLFHKCFVLSFGPVPNELFAVNALW